MPRGGTREETTRIKGMRGRNRRGLFSPVSRAREIKRENRSY